MLEAALASFDAALAGVTGTGAAAVQQRNLARIGRARTLLNLNRPADAAAAVPRCRPASYSTSSTRRTPTRQQNAGFVYQYQGRRWSVADRKGTNGLPFRSASDPRVPWVRGTGGLATGFDNSPLFLQQKYTEFGSAVVLASGMEARLIEAEAALRAGTRRVADDPERPQGQPARDTTRLPASRVSTGSLRSPIRATTARQDLLFRERAFWLYLTSHRLGDLRRLIRQYGRTADQVFPTGEYGVWHPDKSGEYGPDLNFPIPFDEQNNPNFQACLDRNA
jgi:starch-binding outer membrane protein, SusD/RagB family